MLFLTIILSSDLMNKVLYQIVILTIVGFFLTCCSSVPTERSDKVEQRIIFPQYTISYNAENETFSASAQFNLNNPVGTLIKLSSRAKVTFNGEKLKAEVDKDQGRFYYSGTWNQPLPKECLFEYINDDKEIFLNKIELNAFELRGNTFSISKETGATFSFEGKFLNEDETLECFIVTDKENEESVLCSFFPEINGHFVQIVPEMLSVSLGNYYLFFIRRKSSTEVKALDRGGLWETEYCSKKVKVQVK